MIEVGGGPMALILGGNVLHSNNYQAVEGPSEVIPQKSYFTEETKIVIVL